MKLYHGSDHIVEAPTFGLGKPYNDYGLGFYCTQHPDMAGEWAVGSGAFSIFGHSTTASNAKASARQSTAYPCHCLRVGLFIPLWSLFPAGVRCGEW